MEAENLSRADKLKLLQDVSKGKITTDELNSDFIIATFLDLMKFSTAYNLEERQKMKVFIKEPMLTVFKEIEAKNVNGNIDEQSIFSD